MFVSTRQKELIEWIHRPWYGLNWWWRPWKAPLLGRRPASNFWILDGVFD